MLDIKFLFIFSIPIFIIFSIFLGLQKSKNIILYSSLYFYIITVIGVTIFPIPIQGLSEIGMYYQENNNFIPFKSIFSITGNENLNFIIKGKQIIGNIGLFVPLGFFIPLLCKYKISGKKIILIGLLCSLGIEFLQYIIGIGLGFSYKITDIDDVFLNTVGCIIGFLIYHFHNSKK